MVWVFLGDYPRLSQRLLLTSSVSWEKLSQLPRVWEHLTRAGPTTAVPWAHKGPGLGTPLHLHLPHFRTCRCRHPPLATLHSHRMPASGPWQRAALPPPELSSRGQSSTSFWGGQTPSPKGSGPGAIRALLDDAEGSLLKVGGGRGETPGEGLLQSLHAPLTVLC